MKTLRPFVFRRWPMILLLSSGVVAGVASLRAGETAIDPDLVVSVYAAKSPDYVRTRGPDGHWHTESYAFGEGGCTATGMRDDTLEKVRFLEIARMIAPALARQNYEPTETAHPEKTKLLVMVYWGATHGTENTAQESSYEIAQEFTPPPRPMMSPPPNGGGGTAMVSDPSTSGRGSEANALKVQQDVVDSLLQQSLVLTTMANRQRDREDVRNAAVLGYLPELQKAQALRSGSTLHLGSDVLAEVEESRYYVVLLAYDYQRLTEKKERKLCWEVRFSIREQRNDFGDRLAAMAAAAAPYFGRDTDGMRHSSLPVRTVEAGEPRVVGYDNPK
ncbi:MAG TPA: hypothetical protein VHD32_19325 [Candidatus Didemnitutus sp.]|nr:hypothetical protein [Candidatus Didemnitutus sp.]